MLKFVTFTLITTLENQNDMNLLSLSLNPIFFQLSNFFNEPSSLLSSSWLLSSCSGKEIGS